MIDLKNMTTEELMEIQKAIVAELASRQTQEKKELVVYNHRCKNSANYHKNKYKHWAKLVTAIDATKTNGYAFTGEFLNINSEHKVPIGSIIVEVCDCTINGYLAKADSFESLGTAKTNSMSAFIDTLSTYFQ